MLEHVNRGAPHLLDSWRELAGALVKVHDAQRHRNNDVQRLKPLWLQMASVHDPLQGDINFCPLFSFSFNRL